jgi:DNA (cytosine-5)-methyltransferase 1
VTLVLSLFPGIGLLDMAFELEGFSVVRGPDVLWGGDIRRFHPPAGKFDGVIGGPPCQAFSRLAHMVRQNGYEPKFGNLIPEFERVVSEAQPTWFVMENVPDAPTPQPIGYATWSTLLNNRQCIDDEGNPATQNRVRRWTFGDSRRGARAVLRIDTAALESMQFDYAAVGGSSRPIEIAIGGSGKMKSTKYRNGKGAMAWNAKSAGAFREVCRKQGLPDTFELEPFTVAAKCKAVGNGVPIPMGRAIARAVKEAITQGATP